MKESAQPKFEFRKQGAQAVDNTLDRRYGFGTTTDVHPLAVPDVAGEAESVLLLSGGSAKLSHGWDSAVTTPALLGREDGNRPLVPALRSLPNRRMKTKGVVNAPWWDDGRAAPRRAKAQDSVILDVRHNATPLRELLDVLRLLVLSVDNT